MSGRKISSDLTVFVKYWSPFCLVALVAGLVWKWNSSDADFLAFFVAFLFVVGVLYLWEAWPLADRVDDFGSELEVFRRGSSQRIPLSEIVSIEDASGRAGPRLRLRMREPGMFGDSVVFVPQENREIRKFFARNAIAEELIDRVEALKRGAAE